MMKRNRKTMESDNSIASFTRRDFLRSAMAAGVLWNMPLARLRANPRRQDNAGAHKLFMKWKAVPVSHLEELKEDYERLKRENVLSHNPVFRGYIDNLKFPAPENFPSARSIVVVAVFTRAMRITVPWQGKTREILVPPQYYDDGLTLEQIVDAVKQEIGGDCQIVRARGIPQKRLAVRSGLGRYGRNCLCFVEGMGTYLALYSFYTDAVLSEDPWQDVAMMDACLHCKICVGLCPTNALSRNRILLDAGKCVTLYNEVEGVFPKWIPRKAHNALQGCMKCQLRCPENEKIADSTGTLEALTEEETQKIVAGQPDPGLLESLSRKLRRSLTGKNPEEFKLVSRNFKVLLG